MCSPSTTEAKKAGAAAVEDAAAAVNTEATETVHPTATETANAETAKAKVATILDRFLEAKVKFLSELKNLKTEVADSMDGEVYKQGTPLLKIIGLW
jgi:hypothetical protein